MIESIFDLGSTQTEQSGSMFLGPRAQDRSQMPPDLIDGKVDESEAADLARLPGLIAPFDSFEERQNVELPGML